jgi:response regulator NasT
VEDINRSRTRILLVDDDPIVLNTLAKGLTEIGYRVETAENGRDALDHYRQGRPDLVILDYRMPDMTGVEVARLMLQESYRPILILSANSEVSAVKGAIGLGVVGYLVKPVNAVQLSPSIDTALVRFAEVSALIKQGTNLQEGVEKNRLISTATGIVMERLRLADDAAFEHLRRLARDQRRPLREIAFELVDAVSTANRMLSRSSKASR